MLADMVTPLPILIIEDTLSLARTYEEYLKAVGYQTEIAETGKAGMQALQQKKYAALLLDVMLPDSNGLDFLKQIHAAYPDLPVIVMTAHGSITMAVDAMREGAFDFIMKPFPAARLQVTVRNALAQNSLKREVQEWRQTLGQQSFYDFIGASAAMQAVYRIIESVAASKASVFITGESGTGKELAAQAIHKASPRRAKPFIAMNCAAIPHNLLESHIFGHIKGSFTGAVSDQIGAGKAADGGTLFLDEVCEMPLDLQVKLLRFIQTGEVQQVGSTKTEKVDVRLVAATNREPLKEVKEGRFREDLYYRLHVVPIEMPALSARDEDVLLLAHYFLQKFAAEEKKQFTGLAQDAARLFRAYDWPGNVRQLENMMRTIVVLNQGPEVTAVMLPEQLRQTPPASHSPETAGAVMSPSAVRPLWLIEKEAITAALETTGQDVGRAAAMLEVSPSTLYRKLQAWKEGKS